MFIVKYYLNIFLIPTLIDKLQKINKIIWIKFKKWEKWRHYE